MDLCKMFNFVRILGIWLRLTQTLCLTYHPILKDLCKMFNFVWIGGRGSINMWRNLHKPQASKIRLNHKRPFKTNKRQASEQKG